MDAAGKSLYLCFLPDERDARIDEALEHVVHHLLVDVGESRRQRVQPRLDHRAPPERVRLHVDHTAPRHLQRFPRGFKPLRIPLY